MSSNTGVLSFRALQLANEQRNQFGLRYNDYERYRKHCANRTHRLRTTLKTTHGKGREFKKLPAVPVEKLQDGHLQLLLFEAERAWSYSQELLALSNLPSNDDRAGGLRHNATGRFRRAVHWATQLLSQCQALHAAGRLSASGLLEVTAYTLVLNGRFLRYREEFEDALVQLSVARGIFDTLATRARTSRDQALAVYFADETGPEIRICAHELGRERSYDVDGIAAEVGSKHRTDVVDGYDALISQLNSESSAGAQDDARKRLEALEWEGEPVPIRNPELVDVLIKVQEGELKLKRETAELTDDAQSGKKGKGKKGKGSRSKRSVAAYDNILLALSDAEQVARKLVEAQQLSGSTSATAPGTRDIQFVHTYIVYQLLSRRIQRDLLLVSTLLTSHHATRRPAPAATAKPQKEAVDARLYPGLVKLLDTVLQSLNQMRTLSVVDDSPDLATAVEGRISYTSARRCLYLSRCYSPVKKYAEALTLVQRGQIHLREASSTFSTLEADPITQGSPSFFPLSPDELATLGSELDADAASLKSSWFAFNGGAVKPTADGFKKPLFFDIALNYVQLDMDRLEERAGKPKKATPAVPVPVRPDTVQEKKSKVEAEISRTATPEPSAAPARSGLGNLLGGWWGKQ
ncbi:hypothetical protein PENSPDRAFT_625536 [Peniophora sp. CONT]|nr:hypothetical protein PENSPDRAFT_625536 [Peniophora sp. CONT]